MLDFDLAALYNVETKALNQAVRRNIERFPEDFMFQLTRDEYTALRSQIVTLEKGKGKYSKYNMKPPMIGKTTRASGLKKTDSPNLLTSKSTNQ